MPEDKRYLRDLEVGETFTSFVVIRRKELRTRRSGGPYLMLEFGDRSGRLTGNIWDDGERLYHELEEGGVIKLQGIIEQYRDTRQVAVKRLRRASPDDPVDPADLIPASDIDPQEALGRLRRLTAGIGNPHLRALLSRFLDDEDFSARFARAPGGKLWHHNRLGGLIEHTLALCRLCRILGRLYPEADRDLLLAGAVLHDIGKIEEYSYDTFIDYSGRGRLVGHITLGAQWVAERAADTQGFPPDLLDRLLHLILSHQAEHGSPVQPSTREAFLLHYADQIDAKMDAFRRISRELTEGERWKFVRLLDRYIDLGGDEEPEVE